MTTGPVPSLELFRVFWKQLSILGTTMGNAAEFAAMLELFEGDDLRPVVDRSFPLAEAPAALGRMQESGQFGKIVLKID